MSNGAYSTLAFAASAFSSVPSKRLSISAQTVKSEYKLFVSQQQFVTTEAL